MAVLKIVKFGDETLRKVCRPVDQITPRIKTLVKDMIDTMLCVRLRAYAFWTIRFILTEYTITEYRNG